MRLEKIDLHNLTRDEAWHKAATNIAWCIDHDVDIIDIIHGKGHHSQYNFSVIKQEIRQRLKNDDNLQKLGYRVIYGESDFPIALTFDEGHTLIVALGSENNYIGGAKAQTRNQMIYSAEGKKIRKEQKNRNAEKRKRRR